VRAGDRENVRIGVIGVGGVSRFYLEAIRASADFSLAAVCDIDPRRLEPFERSGEARAYTDAAELYADESVEAVVLDTPVGTHVPLARGALEAGKHVCCEKPLALTRRDAEALLDTAADAERLLFTAFHRRYNRNLPAPESLQGRRLARVEARYYEQIEEHSDDAGWYTSSAAEGGGCIVDNGPNAVDSVRHLFGDMSVDEVEVARSPQGVDLQATVTGTVRGGAEAVIRLDWAFEGECKDLRAEWDDGSETYVDFLAGFGEFKSSLAHEYEALLDDFAGRIRTDRGDDAGLAASAWLEDVLQRAGALRT
jgi:predicted dehydrogenase